MKKRVLGLLLISLLLISLIGVVSANTPIEALKEQTKKVFGDWSKGSIESSGSVLKVFILIIIILFVFTLLDFTGFFEKKTGVLFVISIVVGFLATYLMDDLFIKNLANLYTAFGGALITIVPFLILSGFTFNAVKNRNIQMMVMQHIAWILFALFLLYTAFTINDFWKSIVFWIPALLCLVMVFANRFIINYFGENLLRAEAIKSDANIGDIKEGIKLFRTTGKELKSDN